MVYLLADNIISSLGFNTSENFEALKAGRVGIKTIDDKILYPEPFPASLVDTTELDAKFARHSKGASFTRLEKMMVLSIKDALDQSGIDIQSERTGILLSTTKGNIDLLENKKQHDFEKERVLLWRLGEVIGQYFGNPNRVEVLSNACISGVVALNTAAMFINSGKYDHVVVCGGDIVSRFVISGFMSFLSLSPGPCKPFDKKRDGLSLGEAAGTIILGKVPKDGQNIAWLGGASANDANHISGPSRTGEGAFVAIGKAMKEAGLESRYIDHISAHGTATPYNDEMESIAISRHQMESVPVNSLKGNWGHTLGAAGIIETVALIEEMRKSTLLITAGFSSHGVSKPINILDKTQSKEISICLKMASGFGGSNAAALLGKAGKAGGRGPGTGEQTVKPSIHPTIQNSKPTSQITNHNSQITTHNSQISSYCHIKNNKIYLNGKLLFEDRESANLNSFMKKAFRNFKPKYPKFFKMDDISKLGFLAAEVLLGDKPYIRLHEEDIAVVLSNAQSTLVTDSQFHESVKSNGNFFPSPSVFVYTLPNIMIGEISIRHKFRGENAFFIFADFNSNFLTQYIELLFATKKAKACVGGWVEQSANDYEAFVYWTTASEKNGKTGNHTAQEVNKLYKSIA